MLMLAVIGLASAAIMRNAVSGDQVANNNRLQTQASQYAQLALRFCIGQLDNADDIDRPLAIVDKTFRDPNRWPAYDASPAVTRWPHRSTRYAVPEP